jgi:DNA-binding CsgD family transcriptional regulator
MLSQTQKPLLWSKAKGVSSHEIARVLKVSRATVRKVLRLNSAKAPDIQREGEG